jgi:hypothetical protein
MKNRYCEYLSSGAGILHISRIVSRLGSGSVAVGWAFWGSEFLSGSSSGTECSMPG